MKTHSSWSSLLALSFACGLAEPLLAQTNKFPDSGNVGIGTTSPTGKLDVSFGHGEYSRQILTAAANGAGTGDAGFYSWISEPGWSWTGAGIGRNIYNGGTWGARVNPNLSAQMMQFREDPTIAFSIWDHAGNGYNPLTLNLGNALFSGNVGIGILNPTQKLHLAGPDVLMFLQDSNTGGRTYSLGSRWGGYFTIFDESQTTQARLSIAPWGGVGIGATVPGFKLDVQNDNFNAIRAFGTSTDSIGIYIGNQVASGRQWALLSSGGGPSPVGSLTIWDDTAKATRLTVSSSGNVGIGTATPSANLQVNGTVLLGTNATAVISGFNGEFGNPMVGNSGGFRFNKNSATAGVKVFSSFHANSGVEFYHEVVSSTDARFVFNGGNVGIGTTNPTNKLEVAGTIRAKEVIVETTGWSDYVFAPDYRLAPLSEVEAHIQAKGTLPGIPSAAEVAEHGVSVGDMQAKLLAKVEELTLHMIELKKENAELRQEVRALAAAQAR